MEGYTLMFFMSSLLIASSTAYCDLASTQVQEGNLGQSGDFKWLGVLTVHLPDWDKLRIATSGIVLIRRKYALANANDVVRIPTNIFQTNSKAMFLPSQNTPWYVKPVSYVAHPEYEYSILNTIAVIELNLDGKTDFPLSPICVPNPDTFHASRNYLYVMGFTDDNDILEKVIYKIQYEDNSVCEEFYNKTVVPPVQLTPSAYLCGRVPNTETKCVWENGMVLVSNETGSYHLIGFGIYGPGCAAPARFIDLFPYFSWINSVLGLDKVYGDGDYSQEIANQLIPNVPIQKLFRKKGSRRKDEHDFERYPFNVDTLKFHLVMPSKEDENTFLIIPFNNIWQEHEGACLKPATLMYREYFKLKSESGLQGTVTYKLSLYDQANELCTCVQLTIDSSDHSAAVLSFKEEIQFKEDTEFHENLWQTPEQIVINFPTYKRRNNTKPELKELLKEKEQDELSDIFPKRIINYDLYIKFEFIAQATMEFKMFAKRLKSSIEYENYLENIRRTTTRPETTTLENTTPETTTPEITTPATTTPEITTPEPTTLETATPETTTLETTTPETATLETAMLETTTPETTTPETRTRETETPETTTPVTTTPETTTPETTIPETTTPETSTLETTVPETTTPDTKARESTTPETTTPEITNSETTTSETTMSESTTSVSTTSETTTSETTMSEITTSETTTTEPTASETHTSEIIITETTALETKTSEPTASGSTTSETTTILPETTTSNTTTPEATTLEITTLETTTSETTTSDPITSETTMSETTTSETRTLETTTSEPTASGTTTSETTTSVPTTSETITTETTTSETTASGTAPSETTMSEITTSETTTSETTTSESTASGTTTSESTTPETTTSEITTLETITSENTTPVTTAPETATLENTTPEARTPENTTPETRTPENTMPDTTTPETTMPETTTPEKATPKTKTPETTTAETTTLENTTPGTKTPETTTPEITMPETTTRKTKTPETTTLETETLQTTTPITTTPEITKPEITTPENTMPETTAPETTTLETTTPETTIPETETSENAILETTSPETITPAELITTTKFIRRRAKSRIKKRPRSHWGLVNWAGNTVKDAELSVAADVVESQENAGAARCERILAVVVVCWLFSAYLSRVFFIY